ncbi:MAG TPA: GNAT family N-acetyltransferase [Pseudonocardia sp.]|nr:GNAT family N-acetyltransferase [Pseudonocardia sp.]
MIIRPVGSEDFAAWLPLWDGYNAFYGRSGPTAVLGLVCYLQDLFTTSAARGTGVGRALIAAVGERASADGVGRVYWHTHETNATARPLYDKVADLPGFIMYSQTLS